ncbi:MAG: metal-dependent hydrolase [Candidatus Nanoarchaeia archaeon]
MLLRTHLAFSILIILILMPYADNKIIFIAFALLSTLIPDIDTAFSSIGNKAYARIVQVFVKHRGLIHSLTMAIILSLAIAILFPLASLGFFVGYSSHVILDSFTKDGIQPFWPIKSQSRGFIKTGGKIEDSLFLTLAMISLGLIFFKILLLFR